MNLKTFPSAALKGAAVGGALERRKRRAYVSSILAKNEVDGASPYNRRLFYRAAHGYYVLNPALEVEVKGA